MSRRGSLLSSLLSSVLVCLLAIAPAAHADRDKSDDHRDRVKAEQDHRKAERPDSRQRDRRQERKAERYISLDEAVSIVRSRRDGKVIKAETRTHNGRAVHYIKILDAKGRVRTEKVDARGR